MWFDPDNVTPRLRAPRYKPSFPTLRAFIAFARSKPADEHYDWADAHVCACGQFFGVGVAWGNDYHRVVRVEGADLNALAMEGRWTFGALAERAEAKLKELEIGKAAERAFAELEHV